jgi:hypothetical protein
VCWKMPWRGHSQRLKLSGDVASARPGATTSVNGAPAGMRLRAVCSVHACSAGMAAAAGRRQAWGAARPQRSTAEAGAAAACTAAVPCGTRKACLAQRRTGHTPLRSRTNTPQRAEHGQPPRCGSHHWPPITGAARPLAQASFIAAEQTLLRPRGVK